MTENLVDHADAGPAHRARPAVDPPFPTTKDTPMHARPFTTAAASFLLMSLSLFGVGAPPAAAADPALIDPAAAVSLSITKYLGTPTGDANDGRDLRSAAPTLPTLTGVEFDVYRVYTDSAKNEPVDLTTNTGWVAASTITGHRPTSQEVTTRQFTEGGNTYYLGAPTEVVTATGGTATFTAAGGVGLYLVAESVEVGDSITAAPGGAVPANEIIPGAPFLVTLPMTDPETRQRWMYDVHVYPKNQRDTITKTVADRGVVSAQPVGGYGGAARHDYTYTLTSSITDASTPLGTYVVHDDLDPSLTFRAASVRLSGGTALTAGSDYTVYVASGWGQPATAFTGTPVGGGPVVTIVFTASGRTKLESARDQDVVTTLDVSLGARDEDGVVTNSASFVPNDGWWAQNGPAGDPNDPTTGLPDGPVGIVSPPVRTQLGDVVIDKYDPQTQDKLAGATFAVYRDANGDGVCAADEVTGADLVGATAATDAGGRTTFAGLQTSDYYDGRAQTTPTTYCLVETTSPDRYELSAAPRAFTIAARTDGALATTTVPVPNAKSNLGNELPLTGGPGVALLSALGVLLIVGGLGYYVVGSRRRR